MATKDTRIDAYIENAADFAKPVLNHLRKLIHKACPTVEESWKWSFPHFLYKGEILCSMAAFKEHCVFGFWRASLMKDEHKILQVKQRGAMGNFDRIESVKQLPAGSIMISYIKEAVRLTDEGIKRPTKLKTNINKPIEIPDYFKNELEKNKKAKSTFENFSPSHKREYIEWITEAKTDATRQKRMNEAITWMSEGKIRNWKYLKG